MPRRRCRSALPALLALFCALALPARAPAAEYVIHISVDGLSGILLQNLIAASPGNWATEDYEVSMDVVQASLDAEPAGFRAFAAAFAQKARELESAARTRDAAKLSEIVPAMDGACAGCHSAFWYPES